MIFIDDTFVLTVATPGKECKAVQLTQEQVDIILNWVTPEVKKQKTMAHVYYNSAEGFIECQLMAPGEKTPLRLHSVNSLYILNTGAINALRDHCTPIVEVQNFITQQLPDGYNSYSESSPMLYTITFVLKDGSQVEAHFMKGSRYKI